jgi:DNA-binding Xre family transcriptional regulator
MIKFTLKELLEKKGLTAYALHKASFGKVIVKGKETEKFRLHQSVISKIKNNESKALNLDTLDMICEFLDCLPQDLITYEKVARATQNTKHTQNENTTQSASDNGKPIKGLYELTDKDDMWLSTKKIAEYTNREERTVRDFYKNGLKFEPTNKGNFAKFSDLTVFLKNRNQA